MAAPLQQDLVAGIDPTGLTAVQGTDLLNLVQAGTFAADKGPAITTLDILGVPQVPNAQVTAKWQNYLWVRRTATGAILYVWNPNKAFDAILLYWDAQVSASSIQNVLLGNGRILQETLTIDTGNAPFLYTDRLTATGSGVQPQIGDGRSLPGLTTVFTPLSPLSLIIVEADLFFSICSNTAASNPAIMIAALFSSIQAGAYATSYVIHNAASNAAQIPYAARISCKTKLTPGIITPITFSCRAGWALDWYNAAGTNVLGYYNALLTQSNSAAPAIWTNGGTITSSLKVTEYL